MNIKTKQDQDDFLTSVGVNEYSNWLMSLEQKDLIYTYTVILDDEPVGKIIHNAEDNTVVGIKLTGETE